MFDQEVGDHAKTRARMATLLAMCRTADLDVIRLFAEDVAKSEREAIAATSRRRDLTGHEALALDGQYSVPSRLHGRRDIYGRDMVLIAEGLHATEIWPRSSNGGEG